MAVSFEHLEIFAHLSEVRWPSKPSRILLSIRFCLSLREIRLFFCQNSPLNNTRFNSVSVDFKALISVSKNHCNHSVRSRFPFWVFSKIV